MVLEERALSFEVNNKSLTKHLQEARQQISEHEKELN